MSMFARWRFALPLLVLACRGEDDKLGGGGGEEDSAVVDLGTDPATTAASGEAFAGVVRDGDAGESAMTGGITAEARSGDLVLWNDQVRFVVQGVRPGNGIVHTAGSVLDVDVVRTDGSLGRDTIEDMFLAFGLSRLFDAHSVEVVEAGGAGTTAVVQASGTDAVWEYWEGMFERTTPLIPDMGLDIVTTYRLAPDSHTLDITTDLSNPTEETLTISLADGIFASGEDLQPWAPGVGFEGPQIGPLESTWYVGRQGEASVGLYSTEDSLRVGALAELASQLGIFFAEHPAFELAPGETHTLHRQLSVARDVATGEAERREALGEATGTVSGTVTLADGTPVAGAPVHLYNEDGALAVALSDRSGAWTASLPTGDASAWVDLDGLSEVVPLVEGAGRTGPYTAASVNSRQIDVLTGSLSATELPVAAGHALVDPVDFTVTAGSSATVDFSATAQSALHIDISDGDGAPLPALVEVRWTGDARPLPALDSELYEALDIDSGTRQAWAWTATGDLDLPLPPGSFEVRVGHSWRYGRSTHTDVVVTEGETTQLSVTLDEQVGRDGWLSMDSHLHAAPSFDGALPMEHRLVTCATSGVDLPVSTDHDALTDYRGLASAMGLDPRMQVIPGLEVTTLVRGHFNIFPLEPAPLTEVNGGAVRWWDVPADTQEIFDRMRAAVGANGVVQVNHPRSPGMFAFAGYNPSIGEAVDTDQWSWDFQLMELLNGGTSDFSELREDWFSMLDLGHIRVPTGVSDSHYRFIPCGMARTDVYLNADTPSAVTPSDLMDAIAEGHVVVASGTTLRASIDGALPGDTVVGDSPQLDIVVRAPDWISPGTLQVLVNGLPTYEAVLETSEDGVWFDGSVPVSDEALDGDAWVVVEVVGDTAMGDAWRNTTPYAITNAFFLDVSGDGWSAPGVAAIAARNPHP